MLQLLLFAISMPGRSLLQKYALIGHKDTFNQIKQIICPKCQSAYSTMPT